MSELTTERLEKRIKNCIEVGNGCVMLPVSVAEELLAYRKTVNHLLDNDGSRGKFSVVQSYDAREGLERLLAPTAQQNEPQNIPENITAQPDREQIRREHAEWSDATFGNVGPVGPLKHLSKEALEAAADPDDLLEWADMQFLLWDAQRRMGIPDDFITIAMIEKLEINKKRQWPKPKDGEPRLHINTQSAQPVMADQWRSFVTDADIAALHRFVECCDDPESGGHDLEKEQVQQLEQIGALQRSGRISYITDFGDYLISVAPAQEQNNG